MTVLPTACTGPVSGAGRVPVLPLIVNGPTTVLPLNSTPPRLAVIRTGPVIVLGSHGPVAVSPPTRTRPMVPLIVSGPVIVAPQIRTAAAPFAFNGPLI